MDNKYNENLGASSDDRDEAEDLFLRVVKRNDQQSHEASQNKHINNMAENNRSELNAETRAIPKIQQKQGNALQARTLRCLREERLKESLKNQCQMNKIGIFHLP